MGINIPTYQLEFSFARSSGPGGQNVNKVNSKAVLRWKILVSAVMSADQKHRFAEKFGQKINQDGELVISSDRYRDQNRNIADCMEKLQSMLALIENPPKKRKPTKISKRKKEERLKNKKLHSEKKHLRKLAKF